MISPLENNGMLLRTQDYASIKHQSDIKTENIQTFIQGQIDEREMENVRTVHQSDDSDKPDNHHDAREEGKNKYFNNRKKNDDQKPKGDGRVVVKNAGGFDLKI